METATKGARTNLKVFRVKQHLSQAEFADKVGYSRPSYSAIESGTRNGRTYFWNKVQQAFNLPNEVMWELMKVDEQ